jgi:hypothetical protein
MKLSSRQGDMGRDNKKICPGYPKKTVAVLFPLFLSLVSLLLAVRARNTRGVKSHMLSLTGKTKSKSGSVMSCKIVLRVEIPHCGFCLAREKLYNHQHPSCYQIDDRYR